MIKYYDNVEQNSDEWLDLRLGIVTASTINVILTPGGKPAKGQKIADFVNELAAQRLFKRREENFQSYLMNLGHLKETVAREVYGENYAPVRECGFITNDEHGFLIGCSPDGLVSEEGGCEIKSRLAKFQMQTIVSGEMDKGFVNQCQAFLLVSGREWIDFVSYSPGLPLFVQRVLPDPVRRAAIIAAMFDVEMQIKEVMAEYAKKASSLVQTEWVEFGGNDGEIEVSS